MKWTTEKIEILKDEYSFSDLDQLAIKIGTTKAAIIKKAQTIQLYRAKNNQIFDGYKFCSLCQTEHPITEFYKNRRKFDGYEYYCKKYYFKKATTPLSSKALNQTEKTPNVTEKTLNATEMHFIDPIKHRPRNPTTFIDGVEGKVCNRCKTFKPLIDYSKDANGIAGRKATCKSCYKERYSQKRV